LACVDTIYLNTSMCKCESLQKDESKTHSADSSKAYSKLRAFIYVNSVRLILCLFSLKHFERLKIALIYFSKQWGVCRIPSARNLSCHSPLTKVKSICPTSFAWTSMKEQLVLCVCWLYRQKVVFRIGATLLRQMLLLVKLR